MPVIRESHAVRKPLIDQAGSLAIILREEFGSPFRVFDAATGRSVGPEGAPGDPPPPPDDPAWLADLAGQEQAAVSPLTGGGYRLALSLHDEGRPALVAVGEVAALARTPSEAALERARLQKWLRSVLERLRLASRSQPRARSEPLKDPQTSAAWEAILRLENLLRTVRIDKEPAKNRLRVLRAAADLIGVESLAWVPARGDEPVVIEGERLLSPWDLGQLGDTLARSPEWEKAGYLVRNDGGPGGWLARFPQVANLLAMPVGERTPAGWLIALNKRPNPGPGGRPDAPAADGPVPFRRVDAALLTPFAGLIGCLARASQRYHYLKDLLVGLTRSLTAAIDAKDSYTYGHSERVARVAVEIGRELGLQDDELSDIYLAGLLHDIGKIGIRDSVLTKRDKLTDEEFEHIKQHVKIGYRILADLKAIDHLLPGVLYHHERYDGRGYPEGLAGNAIPLLARILAVADSYDAMSTSRPYRDTLPPARVEEILRDGAGSQWDRAAIDAFFRCKDRLHAVRDRGLGESLCNALDGALRNGIGRSDGSSLFLTIR